MNPAGRCAFGVAVVSLLLAGSLRAATIDWLPIPPEDLALKDNPKQPGADAMILYREVDIDTAHATIDNYIRIKVFTQQGVKDRSDVELPYNSATGSILNVRARTINADGKITDFDGKTFDKEIVKGSDIKVFAKTFTLSDVQPGSIIEYMYREQDDARFYWNIGWTIQYDLYTRLARFSIKSENAPGAIPIFWRTYSLPPNLATVQKQSDTYTLEIHNLPGVEPEPLMPPASALEARFEFYYKNPLLPMSETPDQYWKRVTNDWDASVDRFVNKKKELADEVSRDVAPNDPPEVKLRKLYDRVLKIRNLGWEDEKSRKEEKQEKLKPNNNVEDVLKRGYGSELDINFLMVGLARAAGFEAVDIRVANRSFTYFYPQREAVSDLASDVVWVRAGSKEYYLDPAARFYPFGQLPWFDEATRGVRTTNDSVETIVTPVPVTSGATLDRRAELNLTTDMQMDGRLQVDFSGEEAASIRRDNRDEDSSGRKRVVEDEIKSWLPAGSTFSATSIAGWDEVEKPLHVEGTLTVPLFGNRTAERILLPMEVFRTAEVSYFQAQKRVNEVDFPYAYEKTDDLVIHAPPGYAVQAVPNAQTINPGAVSYEIFANREQDSVEVKRHLVVKQIIYPKESYPALREFFSVVKSDDNAQIMFVNRENAKVH